MRTDTFSVTLLALKLSGRNPQLQLEDLQCLQVCVATLAAFEWFVASFRVQMDIVYKPWNAGAVEDYRPFSAKNMAETAEDLANEALLLLGD